MRVCGFRVPFMKSMSGAAVASAAQRAVMSCGKRVARRGSESGESADRNRIRDGARGM